MNASAATRYLGWLTALLWVGLAITGVLLVFFYQPGPEAGDWFRYEGSDSAVTDTAYVDSGLWPTTFSGWLQDGHLWLGVAAVVSTALTALLAMAGQSRRVTSFLAMVLTVGAFAVGLLLPWDQLALWAVEVDTESRGYLTLWDDDVRFVLSGGTELGVGTIQRWLITHAVLAALAGVMAIGWRRKPVAAVVGDSPSES